MSWRAYTDVFDPAHAPFDELKRREMRQDLKECHAWVTRQLEACTDPARTFILTQERKRLAGIYERIRR